MPCTPIRRAGGLINECDKDWLEGITPKYEGFALFKAMLEAGSLDECNSSFFVDEHPAPFDYIKTSAVASSA